MRPIGIKTIDNLTYLNNHLITDLVKEYGTPLYVIDDIQLNKNIEDYKNSFKSSMFATSIVYASKALLTKDLAHIMQSNGFMMDAVSIGDLYVIKESGFDLTKVVFHGNNKSLEELTYAIENGVGIIVVDNLFELKMLNELCNNKQVKQQIMLRINPEVEAHTHEYIQTARIESKFGINIDDMQKLDEALWLIHLSPYLELLGFHAHIGSNIVEVAPFEQLIKTMVEFQNAINNQYHLSLYQLNIGGGFGINYQKGDGALPIKEMMNQIICLLEANISTTHSLINHVMIEPGRSVVGDACVTLYTISQVKTITSGKNYLFVDGGMTDNIRPALYQATYEVDIINKLHEKKELCVDIVGKCCESGDIIRKNVLVPNASSGDILMVYDTGAYTYSMASNYNNQLKAPIVRVSKEEVKLVTRRETLKDLMHLMEE